MTVDDLDFAIEWLRSYENAPDDCGAERCERVAAFLAAESRRRTEAAAVRTLARQMAATPAAVRAALVKKGLTASTLVVPPRP